MGKHVPQTADKPEETEPYTRECLALEADFSLGSGRVTRVLERAIAERGRPENLRSENRPEFTSRRMVGWAEDWKVGLVDIEPGKPIQNGHVESLTAGCATSA